METTTTIATCCAGESLRPKPGPTLDSGTIRTAVVGGSGYTGALLAELLQRHPFLELAAMASDSSAGQPVARALPRVRTSLDFCAVDAVHDVEAAFVCLPERAAAPVVRRLLDSGAAVVDLSPDFRLQATDYANWYGDHPFPEMLPGAYGLTELWREQIREARLVANPGCYPTAALLTLAPLVPLGIRDVIIDAKSGVTGAGKTASERTHFCSVDSDLLAYGVNGHRHYPEIRAGIERLQADLLDPGPAVSSRAVDPAEAADPNVPANLDATDRRPDAQAEPRISFTPHLVPIQRGIVETIYVQVEDLPVEDELRNLFALKYGAERFVDICDQPPHLRDVVGTNSCRIFSTIDQRAGRILAVAAIDNLMKGACGQALQNMNLMLGFREEEALS